MNKEKLLLLLLCIVLISPVYAFYDGPIKIDSIDQYIDIEEKVYVKSYYVLNNSQESETAVSLGFRDIPEDARISLDGKELDPLQTFEAGQVKTILVEYYIDPESEDDIKYAQIDPIMLFDDMINAEQVRLYSITIKLPRTVFTFDSSLEKPIKEFIEAERKVLIFEKNELYPLPINMRWEYPDIFVEKIVPEEITKVDETIPVIIKITNRNDKKVEKIVLKEIILSSDFEILEPYEDFYYSKDDIDYESNYLWENKIKVLNPKETKEISYNLKSRTGLMDVVIDSVDVYVSEISITSSERKIIKNKICGNGVCDEKYEFFENCPEDCEEGEGITDEEVKQEIIKKYEIKEEKPAKVGKGIIVIVLIIIIAFALLLILIRKLPKEIKRFKPDKYAALKDYIEKAIEQGMTKKEIKAKLIEKGWKKEIVENYIK